MTPQDLELYRKTCVRIEPLAIQEEYVRTPSDIAFWSEQYAMMYREWQLSKFNREQEWGRAVKRAREALSHDPTPGGTSGRGKPTVDAVEAEALIDTNYVDAKKQEIMLEAEKVRLAGMMDAIRTKRDMLVSLGAHIRSEIEQGMYIKDREQEP